MWEYFLSLWLMLDSQLFVRILLSQKASLSKVARVTVSCNFKSHVSPEMKERHSDVTEVFTSYFNCRCRYGRTGAGWRIGKSSWECLLFLSAHSLRFTFDCWEMLSFHSNSHIDGLFEKPWWSVSFPHCNNKVVAGEEDGLYPK